MEYEILNLQLRVLTLSLQFEVKTLLEYKFICF